MSETSTMLDNLQTLVRGNPSQVLITVSAGIVIYTFALLIYRAFFHPLAKVPGPRLAGLTYWYEFYYDCWVGGRYLFKFKELHEKYGSIIRISPDEVHINDIDYYDTLYPAATPKHPRWRVPNFMASDQDSMFDTKDPALHRKRRAAEAPSFSKQSIRAIEGALTEVIDTFKQRLSLSAGTGKVLELHGFWNGMTQEVIGRYCFGTDDIQSLRDGKEEAIYLGKFDNYRYHNQWARHFPGLLGVAKMLPTRVLAIFDDSFLPMSKFMDQIIRQVERVLATEQPHIGLKNVFHELRDSKHLPEADRNLDYYAKEAVSFIGGGTETTASSLTTLSYHLLAEPGVLGRMREEVKSVMPEDGQSMPSLAALEALPYLTGVVNEGIRLSFGVPSRLPRTSPNALEYNGHTLPPGTKFGSANYLFHTDERYFPDPYKFEPERWIAGGKELQSKFVPFGRGARMCIGMNLANAELYLAVANIFTKVDMELYETSERDVEVTSEGFIGYRPEDSKGIRVKVLDVRN